MNLTTMTTMEKCVCKNCPFYYKDSKLCRYGGGWGWNIEPEQVCFFDRTKDELERLVKRTNIRW